jgi:hypothetical protein
LASAAEFIPEPRDLVALNTFIQRRSWIGRYGRPLFGLALAAACAAAATVTRWPGGARWPILLMAALGFLVGWLVYRPTARLQAALIFRSARRDGLLVPQRLELTQIGLQSSSPNGETLTRWSAVKEVVRSDEHVFFFISSKTAFLMPRRAFQDPQEFEAFANDAAELQQRYAEAGPLSI